MWREIYYNPERDDPKTTVLTASLPTGKAGGVSADINVSTKGPFVYRDINEYFEARIRRRSSLPSSRKDIRIDGKPGIEYRVELDNGKSIIGVYFKDDKSQYWRFEYLLTIRSTASEAKGIENGFTQSFLNVILPSFKTRSLR